MSLVHPVVVAALMAATLAPSAARSAPARPHAAPAATSLLGVAIVERPAPADTLRRRESGTRGRRTFALSPNPHDRCDYFLAYEASGARVAIDTRDAFDAYMVSHAFVVMRNLDRRWAVGGGVQFHWATGNVKIAPEVRVRRWLDRRQSLEAALGYQVGSAPTSTYAVDFLQQVGPIGSLRYSPHPLVFVQGGLARYRSVDDPYYYYYGTTGTHDETRTFLGLGFAGAGALVATGVEGLAFLGLAIAFSGMD